MKGTLLDFTVQTNTGVISGDDNNRYHFSGPDWKESSMPRKGLRVDFDISQGNAMEVYLAVETMSQTIKSETPTHSNFAGLDPYYQEEFSKISQSNEAYKGKWNWAAFLFGAIWALTKGLWGIAIAAVLISIVTWGVGGLIFGFYFGARGNWMYYNLIIKQKQLLNTF
jgi:hypothetical protein